MMWAGILLLHILPVFARPASSLQTQLLAGDLLEQSEGLSVNSLNVSSCPGTPSSNTLCLRALHILNTGYRLTSKIETKHGLTARLSLAGPACNAFGNDIGNLTIEVTYESKAR